MDAFVSLRGVVRRYGDVTAVNNAGLDVAKGSITALLGPSGCGKTTLLRLIGGLDTPNAGSIALDGAELNGADVFVPPERRHIVMVFQDFALFPHMDVGRNIAFGLPAGADRKRRVGELLQLVGLAGLEHRMPHELSGGQQQRVALARALAAEPRLILLDEPFSNLDPSIRARVRAEVRALIHQVGLTAIFVTHDQDEALSLADQVAVMIDGRILQTGSPRDLYVAPATRAVAEFIGQPNFIPGEAGGSCVSCELGSLPLANPVEGAVDVMVRPEQIVASEAGTSAEVVDCTYVGREQMATLRLGSGALVRARWHPGAVLAAGDRVYVEVEGGVRAFPSGS
jgi:iron(III) transport system ATP-binding protein